MRKQEHEILPDEDIVLLQERRICGWNASIMHLRLLD